MPFCLHHAGNPPLPHFYGCRACYWLADWRTGGLTGWLAGLARWMDGWLAPGCWLLARPTSNPPTSNLQRPTSPSRPDPSWNPSKLAATLPIRSKASPSTSRQPTPQKLSPWISFPPSSRNRQQTHLFVSAVWSGFNLHSGYLFYSAHSSVTALSGLVLSGPH